jgi:exopolysaccharide biosynthesis WecB/TagA/CpsF family protein
MGRACAVAFFMQDFAGGGVEKMRIALAGALHANGYRVTLIVARATGPLLDHVPRDVTLVDLRAGTWLQSVVKLRRFLQRRQPDVLISSLDHNNVAALLAGLRAGVDTKIIICQHNALSHEIRLGWRYRLIPALYALLQSRADAVVAVSHGVAEELVKLAWLPRRAVTVISNPVVDPARLPCGDAPSHPWLINRDRPVFVFAGRLVPQKDPIALLDAFARRLAYGPARLIILGDGPLRDTMMAHAARAGLHDHIVLLGYVADPLPIIAQADALLLTSRYEGFGNVIVEALACGTPVIAVDCPHGPAEILDRGRFGHLIAPGDMAGFARAMAGPLRQHFPAELLRARGLRYTIANSARQYEALIRTVTARPAIRLFGLPVTEATARGIARRIAAEPASRIKLVVTPNLDHVRLLRQRAFRAACRSAALVCPDGWPVALYAHWATGAPYRRVTGCDILHEVLAAPSMLSRRVCVVVESAATAEALRSYLSARGPQANWQVDIAPPNFAEDPAAQYQLVQRIQRAAPDLLIMTLGAPTSEVFIHQHSPALPPCWALCIGQALRVELGLVRRAPRRWRKLGLEWAWRCWQEPGRLIPRYVQDALWFPVAVVSDVLRQR